MNNNFKIVLLVVAFCATIPATAQYRNRNRMDQQSPESQKPPEKVDYVELSLKKMTEELTLDSFQQAVIRNILKDGQTEFQSIMDMDIPSASKSEKIEATRLKLNEKIKANLNPGQVEKYDKLGKGKKKEKKKKLEDQKPETP